MAAPKYAPARADGLKPYFRTVYGWGRTSTGIVWAASLADAKRKHGQTGMRYEHVKSIRRATPADMEAHNR